MKFITWIFTILEGLLPWESLEAKDRLTKEVNRKWDSIDENSAAWKFKSMLTSTTGQLVLLATVIPLQMWLRELYYSRQIDESDMDEI